MATYTPSMYNCAICGGPVIDAWVVRGLAEQRIEHTDAMDCVRILASKLAQAQEDIRALEYRMNTR